MSAHALRDGLRRDLDDRMQAALATLIDQVDVAEGRKGYNQGMVHGLRLALDMLDARFKEMVG
jgi:hypothetical protein